MTPLEPQTIEDDAAPRWAPLMGVTAALAMFGAAQGLSYPLFTLLMQRHGLSPAPIGASAAMMPLGLILSASQVVGPLGLPAVIAGLSALLFVFVIYRSAVRRRS